MMYKTLLAGSALLAVTGSALADEPKKYSSSAKCDFSSVTKATSRSETEIAKIVLKLDDVLCGDSNGEYDIAEATAKAFAKAVSKVEVDCEATGNAKYRINGETVGVAQAKAVAKAYAKALASSNCGKCHAASTTIAKAVDEIYVKATAKLTADFKGKANGGKVYTDYTLLAEAYEERTVDAFAKAIVYAKASDDECVASTKTIAEAGDEKAVCVLTTRGASEIFSRDATAEVFGNVKDIVCNAESRSSVGGKVKAFAKAVATAIAEAYGSCRVSGDAYGCVDGSAQVKTIATAAATAFADGFAKAVSLCYNRCVVDVNGFTFATADIIAAAYAEVNAEMCTGEYGSFDIHEFEGQIATTTAKAIAKLVIETVADVDEGCSVIVKPKAAIRPSPTTVEHVPEPSTAPVHPVHPTHPVVIHSDETSEETEEEKHVPRRGKKAHKGGRRHGKKGGRRGPKKARRHGKKGGRKGPKKARRNGKKAARRGGKARRN